jgi:prepilin-type N-terminal cleavage/methylation domain-containing protein
MNNRAIAVPSPAKSLATAGFTLIELSIVLVIIGLIIGGILVGQDLIRQAEIRATISQIERYNSATNTFRGKFNALPGDMNVTTAAIFGFTSRGAFAGEGDGNGIIEGVSANNAGSNVGILEGAGEVVMFWVDLSSAAAGNLIDGGFNTASPTTKAGATDLTGTILNQYFPQAKLGHGNYIYVYSAAYSNAGWSNLGVNYFGLSAVNTLANSNNGRLYSTATIPVAEAYAIDQKMDDGFPQSGNVMAWYLNSNQVWTDGTNATTTAGEPKPYAGALAGSSTTCYDNSNTSAAVTTYSLEISNGSYPNCALSFKFQ